MNIEFTINCFYWSLNNKREYLFGLCEAIGAIHKNE